MADTVRCECDVVAISPLLSQLNEMSWLSICNPIRRFVVRLSPLAVDCSGYYFKDALLAQQNVRFAMKLFRM